jgi:hypothetical protein
MVSDVGWILILICIWAFVRTWMEIIVQRTNLRGLPEKDSDWAKVEVDEVFGFWKSALPTSGDACEVADHA